MGYLHINNLYRDQRILQFRTCYALEKVHGTSAHVAFANGHLSFASGGEDHGRFVSIFSTDLLDKFTLLGHEHVVVYGEAYGGKQQGMRLTYGDQLRFICFDVLIGTSWLSVPDAAQVVNDLGLEFVPYEEIQTDIAIIDQLRLRPSEVAIRRGMSNDKRREGIVLRPPFEVTLNNGERVIAKHKNDEFRETATPRKLEPHKLEKLVQASAIADEWVTEMRLSHVIDKMAQPVDIEDMPVLLANMIQDIEREAAGEIISSKDARRAISARTAQMFKERLKSSLKSYGEHNGNV